VGARSVRQLAYDGHLADVRRVVSLRLVHEYRTARAALPRPADRRRNIEVELALV
jgi:hypothetical protein